VPFFLFLLKARTQQVSLRWVRDQTEETQGWLPASTPACTDRLRAHRINHKQQAPETHLRLLLCVQNFVLQIRHCQLFNRTGFSPKRGARPTKRINNVPNSQGEHRLVLNLVQVTLARKREKSYWQMGGLSL